MAVGDRRNYSFTNNDYTLWPQVTITELEAAVPLYRARVTLVESASGNNISIVSDHALYRDAEEALEVVRSALTGSKTERRLVNLFAETVNEYAAGTGKEVVTVVEAKAIVWSFAYPSS